MPYDYRDHLIKGNVIRFSYVEINDVAKQNTMRLICMNVTITIIQE